MVSLTIPPISAVLYRIGGMDQWPIPINQKLWRWLGIGVFIALVTRQWLCIATYALAIQAFPYGEKSWLNFLGQWGKVAISGAALGMASVPVLGWKLGLLQAVLGAISFMVIKYFDDKGQLFNPWTELSRGFMGTALYIGGALCGIA